MSRLARYEVELADGVRTTLLLTAEEAKRRGAKPVEEKARAAAPTNKARSSKAAGTKRSSAKK